MLSKNLKLSKDTSGDFVYPWLDMDGYAFAELHGQLGLASSADVLRLPFRG